MAVDEVAIAHDQGLGDNRRSSLGPLYRCNVDYEAYNRAQCAVAKRSYAVEGYRRLVCLKAKKPNRWLVLKSMPRPLGPNMPHPE